MWSGKGARRTAELRGPLGQQEEEKDGKAEAREGRSSPAPSAAAKEVVTSRLALRRYVYRDSAREIGPHVNGAPMYVRTYRWCPIRVERDGVTVATLPLMGSIAAPRAPWARIATQCPLQPAQSWAPTSQLELSAAALGGREKNPGQTNLSPQPHP